MHLRYAKVATVCMLASFVSLPSNAMTRTVFPSVNDTAAVQRAINASSPGNIVQFSPGAYHLANVTLKSGVSMLGASGVVLNDTANGVGVFEINPSDSHDITIQGLSFVGAGRDVSHGAVELIGDTSTSADGAVRIAIVNCSFQNNGIFYVNLKESLITGNSFSNIKAPGSAIVGYYADEVTISHNTFTNIYEPISLINSGPNQGRNIIVSYNTGSGVSRMGIEIQGQGGTNETTNLLVQGNHFTNWVNPVSDGNTTAYSIVTTGTGTRVLNNYAQNVFQTGYGVELSGPGAAALHNYIDGFDCSLIGYMTRDDLSYNNVINAARGPAPASISTFGRTDEIVVGNNSNRNLPVPYGNGLVTVANRQP